MEPLALDREEVRAILSLYHLEGPDDFGGVAGAQPAYWVQAAGRKYFLRITENQRIDDMIFEKEVLLHLARQDLPVPGLVRNVARGTFTPWASRGRYVSLFEYLPGRRLGRFEVRPRHAQRIGMLCGRLHHGLSTFGRRRKFRCDIEDAETRLIRLERALDTRRLAKRYVPGIAAVRSELARQWSIDRKGAPEGTVHGDLRQSSLRFVDGHPVGIVGFECAGTQRWTWDLATALVEWTWCPATGATEGPAGRFDRRRFRSFLRAYNRARPLSSLEQALLPEELRLVCAHEVLRRICTHDLSRSKKRDPYRDYRHYTARLTALGEGHAEGLVEAALR